MKPIYLSVDGPSIQKAFIAGIDIATKDLATLLAGGLSLKRGGQVVGVIDVRGG